MRCASRECVASRDCVAKPCNTHPRETNSRVDAGERAETSAFRGLRRQFIARCEKWLALRLRLLHTATCLPPPEGTRSSAGDRVECAWNIGDSPENGAVGHF